MKWPWVSRASHDRLQEDCDVRLAEMKAAVLASDRGYDALLSRYDDLLEKYHALKVQGAVLEPKSAIPTGIGAAVASLQADELRDLIHTKCGTDFRRRGMMLAQLARDRADKVDDDVIQRRILEGVQADGVPA
jgi:hypothetical protein